MGKSDPANEVSMATSRTAGLRICKLWVFVNTCIDCSGEHLIQDSRAKD